MDNARQVFFLLGREIRMKRLRNKYKADDECTAYNVHRFLYGLLVDITGTIQRMSRHASHLLLALVAKLDSKRSPILRFFVPKVSRA